MVPGMRLVDLQAFEQGFEQSRFAQLETAAQHLREVELEATERAVAGWAAQAGVTVEQWAESFGFKVEHIYEGTTVRVRVEPVALGFAKGRPLTRVVFKQLPPSPPDR